MAAKPQLLLFKGDSGYDITQLVQKINWRGRKGTATRSLNATLIDDDGYKHARSGIDVEEGQQCQFSLDGKELFQGLIMTQTQSNGKTLSFTAYDNGIYLSNNKDTFLYENKTASDVFRDCCTRFGIPMGEVAECSYKIPELAKSKTTPWDAIADALSLDFDATGVRHFVTSANGRVSLLTRRENILQWVIEVGRNMQSYTYTRSIEDIKTRVKMLSKEGDVVAEKRNTELEKRIGIFQEIDTPDEAFTAAQANDLINGILEEKSTPKRSLSVEAAGIPEVVSGIGVYIIIPELGISRTFYVDEDVHTFERRSHTMSLKLTYANDLAKIPEEKGTDGKTYNTGDIVQFNGGYHYISSVAGNPTGSECSAGPAKITLIAAGAKHPYHLIHTDGQSRVYGWVDSGTFG